MGVGFAIVGLRIEKLAARRIQESGQGELVRWGEMQFGLHVTDLLGKYSTVGRGKCLPLSGFQNLGLWTRLH